MRILVVDDKEMHRKSAVETLQGHELTIVKSFDEAMDLLQSERVDRERVTRLLIDEGFPEEALEDKERIVNGGWAGSRYWNKRGRQAYDAFLEAEKRAEVRSTVVFSFDAVLTDMMMPMSDHKTHGGHAILGPGVFEPNEQVPYGFVIALKAALCGAKFVAMVTDTNHHKGAVSAALDHLNFRYEESSKPDFVINGAKVMFVHSPFLQEVIGKETCSWCQGSGICHFCHRTGKDSDGDECRCCKEEIGKCTLCKGAGERDEYRYERKDWGRVLRDLTS